MIKYSASQKTKQGKSRNSFSPPQPSLIKSQSFISTLKEDSSTSISGENFTIIERLKLLILMLIIGEPSNKSENQSLYENARTNTFKEIILSNPRLNKGIKKCCSLAASLFFKMIRYLKINNILVSSKLLYI